MRTIETVEELRALIFDALSLVNDPRPGGLAIMDKQAISVMDRLTEAYCPPDVIISAMSSYRAGFKAGCSIAEMFKSTSVQGK